METIKTIGTVNWNYKENYIRLDFFAGDNNFIESREYRTTAAAKRGEKAFFNRLNKLEYTIPDKVKRRYDRYADKVAAAIAGIRSGETAPAVSISAKNDKMGAVPSVSLMPLTTCPGCALKTCGLYCYACAMADNGARASVAAAYARNTAIYKTDPAAYWAQVRAAIAGSRFFRFHVSGDCPDTEYIKQIFNAAGDFSKCDILIFTKRYEWFNKVIAERGGDIPENLHIMFSGGPGLSFDNPYNIPVAMFIPAGETVPDEYKLCGGVCYECGCRGVGCWSAVAGDIIALLEHGNGHKRARHALK